MSHLIMFFGTDCPSCESMKMLTQKMFHEYGIVVDMHDVWKSESDYRVMENYIQMYCPDCPGIPVFMNTETNQIICGEVSYKVLCNWAFGGRVEQ